MDEATLHAPRYSREYEERWGAGLPAQGVAEQVATSQVMGARHVIGAWIGKQVKHTTQA